jgi:signal transduction histidine kinase
VAEGAVPLELIERQIGHAASTFAAVNEVVVAPGIDPRTAAVPRAVAEAVLGAVWQALTNSVQHAGPSDRVRRSVTGLLDRDSVQVVVEDDGRGFQVAEVPRERLGIRLSILERVHNIDGEARVESSPGRGTRVSVGWTASSSAARSGARS